MLTKMLWQAVQTDPAKTAIVQGDLRLSYEQLYRLSYACSQGLQQHKIAKADCVAVILPNCAEFVISFFACARLDAVMLPLNPAYTQVELQRFLLDGQAKVIITDTQRLAICQKIVTELNADIQLIVTKDITETVNTEDVSNKSINQTNPLLRFDDLCEASKSKKLSSLPPLTNTVSSNPVLYLYTSGSTSEYKRLRCTQENLYYEAHNFIETLEIKAEDSILCTVPLYHSYGFGNGLLDAVYAASTLVLLEPIIEKGKIVDAPFVSRSQRVLELIRTENIGFFPAVPYQFAILAALPDENIVDLSGLKWCISSGDVLPKATYERFLQRFGIAIRSLYGSTEAGSICINTDATDVIEFGSLGAALRNVEIEIRTEQGDPLAVGESGVIWVKSPVIPPSGYDNRPELSLQAFQNGYYDTGDMGKLDQRGHLILTGRKQTFVDIGGYKVDISEVEEILQKHSNIHDVAVLGVDMQESQVIKAVIVRHNSNTDEADEIDIIQYCREHLAAYKIPRLIEFRTELPRSPLGKILKKQLQSSKDITDVSPLSSVLKELLQSKQKIAGKQQQIKVITEQVQQQVAITLQTEVDQISCSESFQNLGFDSIRSVELHSRLIQLTGLSLSITLLWNHPNINELSVVLSEKMYEEFNLSTQEATVIPPESSLRQQSSKQLAMLAEQVRKNEHQSFASEPLAIVGMACRFPGGVQTPEQFWEFLKHGGDGVVDIPKERWSVEDFYDADPDVVGKSYSRWGGFLKDVGHFDPAFFNISPREAQQMDPRQRLLLETAWEALEYAALAPDTLSASRTGVFIGHMAGDYHALQANNLDQIDSYVSTGVLDSLLANRLSYVLNLQGPSVSVDTACSSALTALYLACQSLRQNECNIALVGGVNLILSPEMQIMGAKAGILSPVGRCSTFSSTADGFVRGEGCGMLVVKRLSDALENNDNILAVVRGTAINQDGRTNGIAAPNGLSQQRVIQKALKNALLDAEQITYIETHGTGTLVGDPIEVEALSEVYGASSQQGKCLLGAVKTNIGHLEGAAGIASLIKTVLCLQKRQIPPNIHFTDLNPHIDLSHTRFQLPLETQEWMPEQDLRYAAVSSFGIGGTNGHIILEQAPQPPSKPQQSVANSQQLLTLSAKSPAALSTVLHQYEDLIRQQPDIDLADLTFSLQTGRNHFSHRLAIVSQSIPQLTEQFTQLKDQRDNFNTASKTTSVDEYSKPNIAFLFTGQGSQYQGMAEELYKTQVIFRHHLDECAQLLASELELPLLDILYVDKTGLLNETAYTQPALFALEYSLAKLWQSWGIQPNAVMGHSVGEYVAACIAGVFSLKDGLHLIAARGRLMQALPKNGSMLAVRSNQTDLQEFLNKYEKSLDIAAFNGPNSLVLSGEKTAIDSIAAQLQAENFDTKLLTVSHAFHSALMQPMLLEFEKIAKGITYTAPKIDLISNLTGQLVPTGLIDAHYWVQHVRNAVRFTDSMQYLKAQGCNVFIEIGATPTLSIMGQQCISVKQAVWTHSLQAKQANSQTLLTALKHLYQRGVSIDWQGFNQANPATKITLPSYPFQREYYWLETSKVSETNPVASVQRLSPMIDRMTRSPLLKETLFETDFSLDIYPFLDDHRIYNQVVIPGAAYLAMLCSASTLLGQTHYQLKDVLFSSAMTLESDETRTVQIALTPKKSSQNHTSHSFQLISLAKDHYDDVPQTHMMGQLHGQTTQSSIAKLDDLSVLQKRCIEPIDPQDFYNISREQHIVFGGRFQWLTKLWKGQHSDGHTETLAQLSLPQSLEIIEAYSFHPALLDACFQVAACTLLDDNEVETWLPFLVQNITVYSDCLVANDNNEALQQWWCHAESIGEHCWNITLFNSQGEVSVELHGYEERKAPSEALLGKKLWQDWLYKVDWQAQVSSLPSIPHSKYSTTWVIFADKDGIAQQLANQLVQSGQVATLIFAAKRYAKNNEYHYTIDVNSNSDYRKVLDSVSTHTDLNNKELKLVYLWDLDNSLALESINNQIIDDNVLFDQVEQSCAQLLYLTQALSASRFSTQDRLSFWIVSKNTQAIIGQDINTAGLATTPLWGMAKVIAMEHPNLHCCLLDVEGDANRMAQALIAELMLNQSEESQVAYRNEQRYVSRLLPYALADSVTETTEVENELAQTLSQLDDSAYYLITGGTGGLGLVIAQQLIDHGAKHLVLLARRSPQEEVEQKIAALRQNDVFITVAQVDVSHQQSVADMLSQLDARYPLKGVIHAAGMLDDGVLLWQTRERFAKVMAVKIQGAWNLHQLTQNQPLDFFVLFSSLSSVLGTVGQANYAAANAFLDSLAHYRHAQSLPALSINWGAWSEVGMAAQMSETEQQHLIEQGETLLTPSQGTEIFTALLSQKTPQVGVFPIHWTRYCQTVSHSDVFLQHMPMETIIDSEQSDKVEVNTSWFDNLQRYPSEEQYSVLLDNLHNLIANILGLAANKRIELRQGLRELGLDSILSIEVRSQLEVELDCSLSATLLFDYPTLETLADYLAQNILNIKTEILETDDETDSDEFILDDDLSTFLSDIEQISDSEIQQQLASAKK